MARQSPRQVHHLINALTGEAGHMARQCPRQVHHLINALTVVRQATWPGSVQDKYII